MGWFGKLAFGSMGLMIGGPLGALPGQLWDIIWLIKRKTA